MINVDHVFEAVRRGYNELEYASPDQIIDYFAAVDVDAITGHINNIKGMVFEELHVEQLTSQDIDAGLFEATNHPDTDVWAEMAGGDIVEFQLKATDSVSYVDAVLADNPDLAIVTTSEVADSMGAEVINSGIEDSVLEEVVTETLFDEVVNPVSPLSVLGWLFGLPF